jgi:hypothetical protein
VAAGHCKKLVIDHGLQHPPQSRILKLVTAEDDRFAMKK